MTPQEQVDLIQFMYAQWKETKRELIVFNVVINILCEQNPPLKTALGTMIENARKSPEIQKFAESRFAGFQELIDSTGEGTLQKAIREFLEKAGPDFPTH